MNGNTKLDEIMISGNLKSTSESGEETVNEKGNRKFSVSDDVNGLQPSINTTDSFVVDMESFSHVFENDMNLNSRITLQRNLSRKGSFRCGDKKFNPNTATERDAVATSPKASSHGGISSTPEKLGALPLGATQHPTVPQVHHQITITNGNMSNTTTESKLYDRRFGFRRSSSSRMFDPRRIFLFFATLSSMGTILLIYFTISIAKLSGDDSALN